MPVVGEVPVQSSHRIMSPSSLQAVVVGGLCAGRAQAARQATPGRSIGDLPTIMFRKTQTCPQAISTEVQLVELARRAVMAGTRDPMAATALLPPAGTGVDSLLEIGRAACRGREEEGGGARDG